MCAQIAVEPRVSRIQTTLTWLGGGQWHELSEPHERSAHATAGVIVCVDAALAWLIATLAAAEAGRAPLPAVLALTLGFGVLGGAITRAVANGPIRSWRSVAGRAAVAIATGVVAGELAALVVFSGSIDIRLDEQATAKADSSRAVAQATAALQRTRGARTALDEAVDAARSRRDEALVVARCEYHPSPACPQTRITGVPGTGPETRTANEYLTEAQHELDDAVAARENRAAQLDSQIASDTAVLAQARRAAISDADHGLGSRWVTMNDLTSASAGAMLLRLLSVAFFVLLSLLPLVLRLWRGETTEDRHASARAQRDRAETEADTAIAIKRAEVRAAAEIIWAEHQLARARLAVETQAAIDRAEHDRRVAEVTAMTAESLPSAQLPARDEPMPETPNLPVAAAGIPTLPKIPDVTKAAARWIRPLVPTFVTRAIDTTTQPLRTVRQVFEEVEEITVSLKRTRKVIIDSAEGPSPVQDDAASSPPLHAAPTTAERQMLSGNDELHSLTASSRGTPQLPPAD